jgi:hypothetical protein
MLQLSTNPANTQNAQKKHEHNKYPLATPPPTPFHARLHPRDYSTRGLFSGLKLQFPCASCDCCAPEPPETGVCWPPFIPFLGATTWASFCASPVSTLITVFRSCRPLELRTVSRGAGLGFLKYPPQRFRMSFVVRSAEEANSVGSERISRISDGT